EEEGDLCPSLDASVERLDLRPQAAQVEDLARNGEGAHDVRCRRTRLLAEAEYVGRSTSIDQTVRHLSGDDLAPERVTRQSGAEALSHLGREVALQLAREIRVVRNVG